MSPIGMSVKMPVGVRPLWVESEFLLVDFVLLRWFGIGGGRVSRLGDCV